MSTTTTTTNITCQICGKEHATTKLYIMVGPDHYDNTKSEFQEFLHRLQDEYEREEEEVLQPEPAHEPEPIDLEPTAPTTTTTPGTTGTDKYGIKKLYPDATTGTDAQVWYMNQDNPTSDTRFENWKNANLKKQSDGSWSCDGSSNGKYQVRLEGWSESGSKKWLNCETTVYANYMNDVAGADAGSYAYQVYRGGGHHSSNNPCEGFAYKGRIRKDKSVVITKEILHPDYASNRGGIKKLTKDPKGNYIGVKLVVYNLPTSGGKTPVKVEVWCDETGMNQQGVLDPTKQNWVKMAETTDSGGWGAGTGGGCLPLDKHNTTGKRKPDEIGNMPGGITAGNLAAYRTDGVLTKLKYFSIRAITTV